MRSALIPFRHMDEMIDGFFGSCRTRPENGHDHVVRHVPYADILEGDKDFQIRLDMPGVDREALKIELEDQTLMISAEREQATPEGYKAHRQELPNKFVFKRSFNLGKEIEQDKISAALESGILTITLPKSEKVLPRQIEIK